MRHNHRHLGVLDEVHVLIIDDNELRAAVLQDIRDLGYGKPGIDGTDDGACGDDPVVRLCPTTCSVSEAEFSLITDKNVYQL